MVHIRPRVVVDNEYVSQTRYTIDLDLPTSGRVSTLYLIVRARKDATGILNMPFMRYLISSVSINQAGQAALNAARPEAFQASYYYKTRRFPRIGWRYWSSALYDVEEVIPILFGNKIDDLEHYIDFSKLSDPKLSVTYDTATKGATTAGRTATLWNTTYYPQFTVIANFIEGEGIPGNRGYYSLRQIESFTPVNSQVKKVELKGARPIKRLMLQHDHTTLDYEIRRSLDNIRIYGDNEAWVPYDMDAERWKNVVRNAFGVGQATGRLQLACDDRIMDHIFSEREDLDVKTADSAEYQSSVQGGSGLKTVLTHVLISSGAYGAHNTLPIYFNFKGLFPWCIAPIDFPKMLDRDHLDPTEHAPVYLELKYLSNAATYAGTNRVYIEDLVA